VLSASSDAVDNSASTNGLEEVPVRNDAESKDTVPTRNVSEQTIAPNMETKTGVTVESKIAPQTETGNVSEQTIAPNTETKTAAAATTVESKIASQTETGNGKTKAATTVQGTKKETSRPDLKGLPPTVPYFLSPTATCEKSANQPLSAKKSPPLLILQKMTLSLYRFIYHLFHPLRLFVHKNSKPGVDRKGILKVVLGAFGNMWNKIPASPKDIPQQL
jgi:hypothetical protein